MKNIESTARDEKGSLIVFFFQVLKSHVAEIRVITWDDSMHLRISVRVAWCRHATKIQS